MLKKLISLLLAVCMLICLSACGTTETNSNPTEKDNDEDTLSEENSQVSTNTEDSKEIEEVKLSDSCDKILASGYDADNNYYELVSNETEDYDGLKILIGVIKNNMWILEPTTNMPFVIEENTFSSNGPETGAVHYIGNGCFLSEKKYRSSGFTADYMYIIYNAINGKSYSTSSYAWTDKRQIPIPIKLDDGYMIIGYKRYESKTYFIILNTNEMSTYQITINGYVNSFNNVSEGLFAVAIGDNNYPDYYFYDINGNEKLNLAQYKTYGNQSVNFINQKCTIEIINDNNTKYNITIDKNGTVLSSKKAQ